MFTLVRPVAAKAWRAASSLPATSLGRLTSRVAVAPRQFIVVSGRSSVLSSRGFATAKGRPPKKAGTKKPAAKKTTAKKKKVVAKPKPKKVKKVVSPEEKKKLEARELKKIALLNEPPRLPDTTWLVFVSRALKGAKVGREDGLISSMKELSTLFKALSTSELQQLQEIADRNKLANNAEYKAWVESHTAVAIDDANKARSRLKRVFKMNKSQIQDDRQPKRPSPVYSLFTKSRWAAENFQGKTAPEVAKIIGAEWKSLSASERQPYLDLAKADVERYEKEVKSVLGRTVRSSLI